MFCHPAYQEGSPAFASGKGLLVRAAGSRSRGRSRRAVVDAQGRAGSLELPDKADERKTWLNGREWG